MAGENTLTTMQGLFKEVYSDHVVDMIPRSADLTKSIAFVDQDMREGNVYHQPVTLTAEHGITYAGSGVIGTGYNLNAAVAAVSADAQITATEITGAFRIAYGVLYKASAAGKRAFVQATQYVVRNAVTAMTKRVETMHFYGGPPGTLQTSSAGLGSMSAISGTTTNRVFTISNQSWAPGIWAGLENCSIDAYRQDTNAKLNTNAAIVITAVDFINHLITVTGNAADLTAIDAQVNNTVFYFLGANGSESLGLRTILGTQTGNLFNVATGTYGMWKPNVFNANLQPLSLSLILRALDLPAGRGLMEDVTAYVPTGSITDLINDYSALRRLDSSYQVEMGENGVSALRFHGQTGTVTIKPSIYVKQGDCFIIAPEKWRRVGSTDVTFRRPTVPDGETQFLVEVQGAAAFEFRGFTAQAMFTEAPAHALWIYNVSPTHNG